MSNQYGTTKSQELSQRRITLDPRSLSERLGGWMTHPKHYAAFQLMCVVASIGLAFFSLEILGFMLLVHLWYSWQRHELPLRYPSDLGGMDPSLDEMVPGKNGGEQLVHKPAMGILYLGNQRSPDRAEHLKELWLTNSDARTHMLLMGTTGSGKTVTLLSICFNALAWGSGFFYSDGKADSSLHATIWNQCRRVGREDDYLVVNFMTGGADPYKKRKTTEKSSNGMNPWYEGSPDFLSQLSSSLLTKASGDGAQWQQKAVNMMDALIRTLCYERAIGNLTLSIAVIREYLALPNLVKLYLKGKNGEIPEYAFLPIKAYLETGLPGFRPDLATKPEKWDQTVYDQHGYLTGQYARTLAMLMDTYGFIFKDKFSEVDMMDVLLNRRILVVLIPTLEKSAQEAANLGKLVVSSIRLMMAMNLGHRLEGTYADIIETKATNSKAPYIITMDELGYYFAEGIALMFAQARSLGFMMIAAGQDIAAMAKGENKEEVDSMIANTKVKYSLALEDPGETLEIFQKVAGKAITIETDYYEGSVSSVFNTHYRQNLTGRLDRRDRLDLSELKALREMEGVLIFKDQVVRARSFTWFHSLPKTKLPFRLNRFLQVEPANRESMGAKLKPIRESDRRLTLIDSIMMRLREGRPLRYQPVEDPVCDAICGMYNHFESENPNESPVIKGIAYYMAAVKAMRTATADSQGRYWREIQATGANANIDEPAPLPELEPAYAGGYAAAGQSSEGDVVVGAARDVTRVGGGLPYGGGVVSPIEPNSAFHDPALTEKPAQSFEDMVRSFTDSPEIPADYAGESATEMTAKKYVSGGGFADLMHAAPAEYQAHVPEEALVTAEAPAAAGSIDDLLSGAGLYAPDEPMLDAAASLEALARPQPDGRSDGSVGRADSKPTESGFGGLYAEVPDVDFGGPGSVPASDLGAFEREVADGIGLEVKSAKDAVRSSENAKTGGLAIGFTDETTQTLVKIEAALGSEDPVASTKSTEADLAAELMWNKPAAEMSDDDLDALFSNISDVIAKSASRGG